MFQFAASKAIANPVGVDQDKSSARHSRYGLVEVLIEQLAEDGVQIGPVLAHEAFGQFRGKELQASRQVCQASGEVEKALKRRQIKVFDFINA